MLTRRAQTKARAFTRKNGSLGLTACSPQRSALEEQARHSYYQYQRLPGPLSKNIINRAARPQRVLFFRFLGASARMIP